MSLLPATKAAELLGVSRRALGRKSHHLEATGQAVMVGERLMYESQGLSAAYAAITEVQVGNAEQLAEMAQQDVERDVAAGVIPDYGTSRARREHYLARLAELEVQVREGQLVDAAGVQAATFERGRKIRNQILGLPARIAADLASEDDPARAAILLERELVDCLLALEESTNG